MLTSRNLETAIDVLVEIFAEDKIKNGDEIINLIDDLKHFHYCAVREEHEQSIINRGSILYDKVEQDDTKRKIEEGLKQAATGDLYDLGDFSKYCDDKPDEL